MILLIIIIIIAVIIIKRKNRVFTDDEIAEKFKRKVMQDKRFK